ncbi:hypothetical protein GR328_19245 [Microvirga makkahensis]|uniref:Uncharacterized protein n=2 Tax=Microvirga makkahensis TaxID=1128670 RepID=A0A7X3MUN1_9HYPH|nr:hypothetical protein [Microvirga makkahensis]
MLEHHGYQIRLRRTQVDWIGFITRRGQRPPVILASVQKALIAKAQAWIEERSRLPALPCRQFPLEGCA